MKEIQTIIYEAFNGKQFLNKEECEEYELEKAKGGIRYFRVYYDYPPKSDDFQSYYSVAVCRHRNFNQTEIISAWALEIFGHYLKLNKNTSELQRAYLITETGKEDYDNDKSKVGTRRVFLSEDDIPGFPPKIDIIKHLKEKYSTPGNPTEESLGNRFQSVEDFLRSIPFQDRLTKKEKEKLKKQYRELSKSVDHFVSKQRIPERKNISNFWRRFIQ